MPYIKTEQVKEIRIALKNEFPNVKFSVVRQHHSTVVVSILESSINFDIRNGDWDSVNTFYIDEHYADNIEAKNFLNRIHEIINATYEQKELVYDGDYGSVPNYYIDINIGKWDKPYILKKAA